MFKISIYGIIKDHLRTLVNDNTGKPGFDDYFSFFALPILISLFFIWIGFDVDKDSIETIVGSLAIFNGLLFNALVILIDIARKSTNKKVKNIIVNELTAHISFSILISLMAIFIMLLGFIDGLKDWIKFIIHFSSFFLLTEFLLTFLMILKRTYRIFQKHMKD